MTNDSINLILTLGLLSSCMYGVHEGWKDKAYFRFGAYIALVIGCIYLLVK